VRLEEIAANRNIVIEEHQDLTLPSSGARIAGCGALTALQTHGVAPGAASPGGETHSGDRAVIGDYDLVLIGTQGLIAETFERFVQSFRTILRRNDHADARVTDHLQDSA
jgi:hypothetical protein